jgi:hypothetical protein
MQRCEGTNRYSEGGKPGGPLMALRRGGGLELTSQIQPLIGKPPSGIDNQGH